MFQLIDCDMNKGHIEIEVNGAAGELGLVEPLATLSVRSKVK